MSLNASLTPVPLRIILVALTIVLAFNPTLASANGRATLISSQEKGPYRIDVSILPNQPIVSNTHLSVLVRTVNEDQIITDASVTVTATGPPGSTDLGPLPAENNVTPQFFETALPFDAVGDWLVMINVSSELGEETVVVPMNVREGGGFTNWILLAAVAVAILTVGVWTWDRVAGRRSKADVGEQT
ncbi:MAG TPA: hypothetical protein VFA32_16775 [Dehalococcoidia bacterium]|nr:hypothetical protein [Dehalococcoidia bacterium]